MLHCSRAARPRSLDDVSVVSDDPNVRHRRLTLLPEDYITSNINVRNGNPTIDVSIESNHRVAQTHSFVSFIRSRLEITDLLLLGHRVPLLISRLISPYVIALDRAIEHDIHARDTEKGPVPTLVIWRIVFPIDVGYHDPTSLHEHVV